MSKNSKIVYLILTTVFFIFLNFYLTDTILKSGYILTESPILDIVFLKNTGAAFNIFEGYKVFLIIFAFAAFLVLVLYALKHIKNISGFGLFFTSLLLSGIFNNMCERMYFGYVRDYIKLNFIDFPVFNISDVFINIAVFGLIFIILKNNYLKKDNN